MPAVVGAAFPVSTRFAIPPVACDCHVHFYGDHAAYPVLPTAHYAPPPATPSMYSEAVMRRLGMDRLVAVQPTAYGADNSCLLDAMAEFGSCARGVAVVTPDTSDGELEDMHLRGVRGARFFMLRRPIVPWEMLGEIAARIAVLGWHVQLQFDGRELPERMAQLRSLPCAAVIDHNGKFLEPVAPDSEAVGCLLRLLDSGRWWVKASAPYETSKVGPPSYDDVGAVARKLIDAAPERVVWATNWPHGGVTGDKPDDWDLLNVLSAWALDDAVRYRILVDNPATLYGF